MHYKAFLLALIPLINNVVGQCPHLIDVPINSPCRWYISGFLYCDIKCDGNESFDIRAVFTDLSAKLPADRKPFRSLYLYNTAIEELPANAFAGIQFTKIYINNNHLKRVNVAAFDGTIATITALNIWNSPVSESVTNTSDLFGAIDTLKALEVLQLSHTGVQSLPSLSLSGLRKLKSFTTVDNPLRSIFANAFNDLPALKELHFYGTSPIERVSEHAFTVGHNTTDQKLEIYFDSQLTDIRFGWNSMRYLTQNAFEVFFSENSWNRVYDESIDCADSRNQWIQEKYPNVWYDLKCA